MEPVLDFMLVAFIASGLVGMVSIILISESSDRAEKAKNRKQLNALKCKSEAHKLLVPVFMEQRNNLENSLSESFQAMRETSDALGLSDAVPEVSADLMAHEEERAK